MSEVGRDGKLTTHVLDTASGRPAAGLELELFRLVDGGRTSLIATRTDTDGRSAAPLLSGEAFATGVFELVFQAGAWLDAQGLELPQPKFLDEVVIRFGIAERRHYHVPLLLSPFGYSTYRGS